jgi:hypothetical protein
MVEHKSLIIEITTLSPTAYRWRVLSQSGTIVAQSHNNLYPTSGLAEHYAREWIDCLSTTSDRMMLENKS